MDFDETNSKLLCKVLKGKREARGPFEAMVKQRNELLMKEWRVELNFIFKEANMVTDVVAKWVLNKVVGYYVLGEHLI